jgi:hypothetical protein
MSWSYSPSLSVDKDKVRFLIGDVDSTNQVVQDEEILWALTVEKNVWMAAAAIADALAAKFQNANVESLRAGELEIVYKRINDLQSLSKSLRTRGMLHMLPSAGGVFGSDRTNYEENTSLIQPYFRVGMHDNTGN